jgi:SAM-dependent methyltransferase
LPITAKRLQRSALPLSRRSEPVHDSRRHVLHVGCGPLNPAKLHKAFQDSGWRETRLDIDARTSPDIVSSIAAMQANVPSKAFDALWSSHTIEHLDGHEVPAAFAEFLRVLSPRGFALLRCPDILAVAEAVVATGLDDVAYLAPAGPITPLDMLYGHGASIARGNHYMRHQTGFTEARLARMLLEAGFDEVRTCRRPKFDLWALALKDAVEAPGIIAALKRSGLDFDDGDAF